MFARATWMLGHFHPSEHQTQNERYPELAGEDGNFSVAVTDVWTQAELDLHINCCYFEIFFFFKSVFLLQYEQWTLLF